MLSQGQPEVAVGGLEISMVISKPGMCLVGLVCILFFIKVKPHVCWDLAFLVFIDVDGYNLKGQELCRIGKHQHGRT